MAHTSDSTPALLIDPAWIGVFPDLCNRSIEAFCTHFGIDIHKETARSVVQRHTIVGTDGRTRGIYIKLYTHRRKWWQGLFRSSKAFREARNLGFFRQLGLAAPAVVAVGVDKILMGTCQQYELIVTEEVRESHLLADYWQMLPPGDPQRRSLIDAFADQTRRMHAQGFLHRDLKWRNLLVTPGLEGRPALWWIDCPNGIFPRVPFLARRGIIKDIATMMKLALPQCTPAERLRFVAVYLRARPRAEKTRFIAEAIRYHDARW